MLLVLKLVSVSYLLLNLGFPTVKVSDLYVLKFSDIDSLTYSVLPRDSGVGEGSWAGLCFSPSQWSMVPCFLFGTNVNSSMFNLVLVNIFLMYSNESTSY